MVLQEIDYSTDYSQLLTYEFACQLIKVTVLYNPKLIRFLIMRKYTLADGNMRLSSLVPGLANAARKLV